MIRAHIVGRIFRREMLDTLRDWNMICIVVILPFILTPLGIVAMVEMASQKYEESRQDLTAETAVRNKKEAPSYKVGLVGSAAPEFESLVKKQARLKIVPLPDFPSPDNDTLKSYFTGTGKSAEGKAYREAARQRIESGTVDAILAGGETAVADSDLRNSWLVILSDETIPRSEKAGKLLEKKGRDWRDEYRAKRLELRGETESTLRPLSVSTEALAPFGKMLSQQVASIIPVLFFLILISGCFYAAINAIPGEKERGTLATLLSAPVRPLEVLVGKWLNVMLIGFLSAFANTASLLLAGIFALGSLSAKMPNASRLFEHGLTWATIPWGELALLLSALIGLAMVFSAATLMISLFARRVNDGNYLLTPLIIAICIPAAIGSLPSTEWTLGTAVTPVLNSAVLIREIFKQTPLQPALVLVSFLSCVLTTVAILLFGARVFDSERVRFSAPEGRGRKSAARLPGMLSGTTAMVAVLLILPGIFYLSIATTSWSPPLKIIAVQAWVVAATLGVILVSRLSVRESLGLYAVSWKIWPGVVLTGLSAWVITLPFQWLFPMPEPIMKAFYETLREVLAGPGGLAAGLLLIAALPAVCEEIAFRGLVQAGLLKRFPPAVAIILTSVAFGLAHYSVFRFLPTAILGVLLGWVRWRSRSLFPGMLIHGLNNGLAVLALATMPDPQGTEQLPPWPMIATAILLLILGLLWIVRTTRQSPAPISGQ